jgi:hypothetical protein
MKPMRFPVFATVLALAACGGGSGSSSSGTSSGGSPTFQALNAGTVFSLTDGGTLTLQNGGSAIFADPSLNGGNPVTLTPAGSGDPSTSPNFAGGTTLVGTNAVLERLGGATGLSQSDFGVWNTRSGNVVGGPNFFAAGQATAVNLIPPQGAGVSAIYNGTYIANLSGNTIFKGMPLAAGPFSGSVQINANFDTQQMRATFGGLLNPQISIGSTFTPSSNAYTIGGNTASNFAFGTFTLNGKFYGAPSQGGAPPETAGLINGTLGGPATAYNGSFGAHR